MPGTRPGVRLDRTATKQVVHGAPCIEKNAPGIAFKTAQAAPAAPNAANAAAAKIIIVGEDFIVDIAGSHDVAVSLLPAGAVVGDALFIDPATNVLHKFGDASTNEVQTITPPGSGNFTYTLDGETSAPIAFNATAAAARQTIEGMSNVQPGDVTVTGGGGANFVITFVAGRYSGQDAPNGTVSAGSIAVSTPGVSGGPMVKYGVIDAIDTDSGLALVNLNLRSII